MFIFNIKKGLWKKNGKIMPVDSIVIISNGNMEKNMSPGQIALKNAISELKAGASDFPNNPNYG